MGIASEEASEPGDSPFGRELPSYFQHVRGFSRTWFVERLPGTEIEPGWLFHLLPPGLSLRLAWHASPLPAAWTVHYLQRPLINMRARPLQSSRSRLPRVWTSRSARAGSNLRLAPSSASSSNAPSACSTGFSPPRREPSIGWRASECWIP